ncbi:MAG: hypothetical protein AMXMBFR34_30110 [Myxococcaceae bacterium]
MGTGVAAPLVLVPDETGEHRSPTDVVVNGRFESWPLTRCPFLVPGDVLCNLDGEVAFRVPTALTPEWKSERCVETPRDEYLQRLEREAARARWSLAAPDPRMLLGAARAWRVGALRTTWAGGFVVEARWAPAATVRTSLALHLWQLLASPAGFALERFSGTPVDDADRAEVLQVVRNFPSPRLRELVLEEAPPFESCAVAGVSVHREGLPWLELDGALPQGVSVSGPSPRLRVTWTQPAGLRLNEGRADDRCVWSEPLWAELRAGDTLQLGDQCVQVLATH